MNDEQKSLKQINPDLEPTGKYQEAVKSPLIELESKEALMSRLNKEEEE